MLCFYRKRFPAVECRWSSFYLKMNWARSSSSKIPLKPRIRPVMIPTKSVKSSIHRRNEGSKGHKTPLSKTSKSNQAWKTWFYIYREKQRPKVSWQAKVSKRCCTWKLHYKVCPMPCFSFFKSAKKLHLHSSSLFTHHNTMVALLKNYNEWCLIFDRAWGFEMVQWWTLLLKLFRLSQHLPWWIMVKVKKSALFSCLKAGGRDKYTDEIDWRRTWNRELGSS